MVYCIDNGAGEKDILIKALIKGGKKTHNKPPLMIQWTSGRRRVDQPSLWLWSKEEGWHIVDIINC